MKIVQVGHPGHGGSGRVAARLGEALADTGDEVCLLTTAEPVGTHPGHDMQVRIVEPPDHPVFTHEPVTLAMAGALAELTREHGIELIHCHFALPWATAAWIAREMLGAEAPALVVTLHGSDVFEIGRHPLYRETTRTALSHADAVTAVSAALREAARTDLETDMPIEVVPNFVPPVEGASHLADPPWLAHVSNFRPVKRPLDVIEIFSRVRAERHVRLRLVGDGPEVERCRERAAELGVLGDIEPIGPTRDAIPYLRDVRVLLAPSDREAFGLAPLEAQACGVPVVGSAVDGLPEVVTHGETGFLHPVGDVDAMARSVLRLLDDEQEHARMAQTARRHARERFDQASVVARYRAIYASAQKARRRAA